jgi:hypothetical protein
MVERVAYDPYGRPTFYDGSWANPSAASAAAVANDVLFTGHRSGRAFVLAQPASLFDWLEEVPGFRAFEKGT